MTQNLRLDGDLRPGTYMIDTVRSSVRLTATHVFGLKPVNATMNLRSGTVMVGTHPDRSTVSAELDAATFTSDDPRRDKDIKGRRFLAATSFPTIDFRSTGLTRSRDGWHLTGILSVRGGSSSVTLKVVDVQSMGEGYRFRAMTTVDRVAAGVSTARALIGRQIKVTLECCVTPR